MNRRLCSGKGPPTAQQGDQACLSIFESQTDSKSSQTEQIGITAGVIIAGLTNNPAFPPPPVDLKTVQTAVDDLNTALAAQAHGGTAATAEKSKKQGALIVLLRKLKRYVEDNCGDNLALLLSIGFQPADNTRNRTPWRIPPLSASISVRTAPSWW